MPSESPADAICRCWRRGGFKAPLKTRGSEFSKKFANQLEEYYGNLWQFARTLLPTSVVLQCCNGNLNPAHLTVESPYREAFYGCVVVIHVPGPSRFAARLGNQPEAASLLTHCLNRVYALIIDIVDGYGGDVMKMEGNTLLVLFKATRDYELKASCGTVDCTHNSEDLTSLRAAACCVELQKFAGGLVIGGEPMALSIGVSSGQLIWLVVFSQSSTALSSDSYKHFLVGKPLDSANEAASLADLGQTVLHRCAWELIASDVLIKDIENAPDFRFLLSFEVSRHTYPMVRHAAQCCKRRTLDDALVVSVKSIRALALPDLSHNLELALRFFPTTVTRHLAAGMVDSLCTLRSHTMVLAYFRIAKALTVELVEAPTRLGSGKPIGQLISDLETFAFAEEGSLITVQASGEDLLLQFSFGMPPLVHADDPLRAVRASCSMSEEARREGIVSHAGIAYGHVFCGVLGNNSLRRDYIVVGSVVDAALELCFAAPPHATLVDHGTACRSCPQVGMVPVVVANAKCRRPTRSSSKNPWDADFARDVSMRSDDANVQDSRAYRAVLTPQAAKFLLQASCHELDSGEPGSIVRTPTSSAHSENAPWLAGPTAVYIRAAHLASSGGVRRPSFQEIAPYETETCSYTSEASSPPKLVARPSVDWAPDGMMMKVRLPWPPRTVLCSGSSPLPSLTCWRSLYEASTKLNKLLAGTGGPLIITGSAGCGKIELLEHLICQTASKGFQLAIGAGEMRSGSCWPIYSSVLRGLLAVLHPSGYIGSDEVFRDVLLEKDLEPRIARALMAVGIANLATPEKVASLRKTRKPSKTRSHLIDQHAVVVETKITDGILKDLVDFIAGVAKEVLEKGDLVVALRISQGTTMLNADIAPFWALVEGLTRLADHPLCKSCERRCIVYASCRPQHLCRDLNDADIVHIDEFTWPELVSYTALCLEVENPLIDHPELLFSGPNKTHFEYDPVHIPMASAVPEVLITWLHSFCDCPRDVEECLARLNQDKVIATRRGKCVVLNDISDLNVATWTQTSMVTRVTSQLAAMDPDMQHIMQVASMMLGPFSSLDLAYANRGRSHVSFPRLVVSYQAASRLNACEYLVELGLLARCDRKVYRTLGEFDVPAHLPRWRLQNNFVRKVISASVKGERRARLKCAILVGRALETLREGEERQRRSLKGSLRPTAVYRAHAKTRDWVRDVLKLDVPLEEEESPAEESNLTNVFPICSLASCDSREFAASSPRTRERHASESSNIDWQNIGDNLFGEVIERGACRLPLPSSCVVDLKDLTKYDDDNESLWSAADEDFRKSMTISKLSSLEKGRQSVVHAMRHAGEMRSRWQPRDVVKGMKLVGPFHSCLTLALLFALYSPDFWYAMKLRVDVLYALMTLNLSFLVVSLAYHILFERNYLCSQLFVADCIILSVGIAETKWVYGPSTMALTMSDTEVERKNMKLVGNMVATWLKFGACCARLFWLFRRPAVRRFLLALLSRLKLWKQQRVGEGSPFLRSISEKLAAAILAVFSSFSALSILIMYIFDMLTPPLEDSSMSIWVRLLAMKLISDNVSSNSVSPTSGSFVTEIRTMERFFIEEIQDYGPYDVCKYATRGGLCQHIWGENQSLGIFSKPARQGWRLYAQADAGTSVLQTAFDLSEARRSELMMKLLVISLGVICMLGAAVSLDIILARLLVQPLSHIMGTVADVSTQFEKVFPMIEFVHVGVGGEDDEVAAFKLNVEKVTKLMAKHTDKDRGQASAWMEGIAEVDAGKPGLGDAVVTSSGTLRSEEPLKFPPSPNVLSLEALGICYADIDSWNFDVFTIGTEKINAVTSWIIVNSADAVVCANEKVISQFLTLLSKKYLANPYHSWQHAVDVVHGVKQLMSLVKTQEYWPPVEMYAMLVAAAGHDVAHPGYNNPFLVQTGHQIALRYNDTSPLESMHCSVLFDLLLSHNEANVFRDLTRDLFKEARRVCIETILHTDNAFHFEMMKEMQLFYTTEFAFEKQQGPFPSASEVEVLKANRKLCANAILHAADVSNTSKPWILCRKWAELVLDEFFLQGDKEKEMGIPVQMLNDRNTVNLPTSQVAFIQLFIVPFNLAVINIFPVLWQLNVNLASNLKQWHSILVQEKSEKGESVAESTTTNVNKACEELNLHVDKAWRREVEVNLEKPRRLSRKRTFAKEALLKEALKDESRTSSPMAPKVALG